MLGTLSALDGIELAAWEDAYCAVSPAVRAAGIRHTLLDGVLVTTAPDHDVLALNRAIGLAHAGASDVEAVDGVLDVFRTAGSARCMIAVPPGARRVAALLEQRGCYHHNSWVKITRDAAAPPAAETSLTVRRLGAEHGDAFGRLIGEAFDWPAAAAGLFGATVGRDEWVHYGAFDGERLVAGGGMFVRNRSAWLGPAATAPDARGRGAQSALIAARLRAGRDLGVTTFTSETAEPTPERDVPSLRNLQRFGFTVAYVRPNWVTSLA